MEDIDTDSNNEIPKISTPITDVRLEESLNGNFEENDNDMIDDDDDDSFHVDGDNSVMDAFDNVLLDVPAPRADVTDDLLLSSESRSCSDVSLSQATDAAVQSKLSDENPVVVCKGWSDDLLGDDDIIGAENEDEMTRGDEDDDESISDDIDDFEPVKRNTERTVKPSSDVVTGADDSSTRKHTSCDSSAKTTAVETCDHLNETSSRAGMDNVSNKNDEMPAKFSDMVSQKPAEDSSMKNFAVSVNTVKREPDYVISLVITKKQGNSTCDVMNNIQASSRSVDETTRPTVSTAENEAVLLSSAEKSNSALKQSKDGASDVINNAESADICKQSDVVDHSLNKSTVLDVNYPERVTSNENDQNIPCTTQKNVTSKSELKNLPNSSIKKSTDSVSVISAKEVAQADDITNVTDRDDDAMSVSVKSRRDLFEKMTSQAETTSSPGSKKSNRRYDEIKSNQIKDGSTESLHGEEIIIESRPGIRADIKLGKQLNNRGSVSSVSSVNSSQNSSPVRVSNAQRSSKHLDSPLVKKMSDTTAESKVVLRTRVINDEAYENTKSKTEDIELSDKGLPVLLQHWKTLESGKTLDGDELRGRATIRKSRSKSQSMREARNTSAERSRNPWKDQLKRRSTNKEEGIRSRSLTRPYGYADDNHNHDDDDEDDNVDISLTVKEKIEFFQSLLQKYKSAESYESSKQSFRWEVREFLKSKQKSSNNETLADEQDKSCDVEIDTENVHYTKDSKSLNDEVIDLEVVSVGTKPDQSLPAARNTRNLVQHFRDLENLNKNTQ